MSLSKLEDTLRALTAGTNYEELLDDKSIFKLLYSLRIIDTLMQPKAADPSPEAHEQAKVPSA